MFGIKQLKRSIDHMKTSLDQLTKMIGDIKVGAAFDPTPINAEIATIKAQQASDEADISQLKSDNDDLNTALTAVVEKLSGDTPDVAGAIAAAQEALPDAPDNSGQAQGAGSGT